VRENKLVRFGHVIRGEDTEAVTIVLRTNIEGRKRKRRPKKEGLGQLWSNSNG